MLVVKSNKSSVELTFMSDVSLCVILLFLEVISSKLINPGHADEDQSSAIKLKKRLEYAISSPKQRVFRDVGINVGLGLVEHLLLFDSVENNDTIKLDTMTVDTKPTRARVTFEHIM